MRNEERKADGSTFAEHHYPSNVEYKELNRRKPR
jgi:hypothetical protein